MLTSGTAGFGPNNKSNVINNNGQGPAPVKASKLQIVRKNISNVIQRASTEKNNRVNSAQCYYSYQNRYTTQRTRNPNKLCKLEEITFTCGIPTLFSLPDCLQSSHSTEKMTANTIPVENKPANPIQGDLLEKYADFWEISNTYIPNCKQFEDTKIDNPGPIQMFVLKYNELVQSLHDKVVNFTHLQPVGSQYPYQSQDLILLKYYTPPRIVNAIIKTVNFVKKKAALVSSKPHYQTATKNDVAVAKYNVYLNANSYAAGILSDYDKIQKMAALIKNYETDITNFQQSFESLELNTSYGKMNDGEVLSFPMIISGFVSGGDVHYGEIKRVSNTTPSVSLLNDAPAALGTDQSPATTDTESGALSNASSSQSSNNAPVSEFNTDTFKFTELPAKIMGINDKLHNLTIKITTRFQQIRNNLFIANSLYILYADKFRFETETSQLVNESLGYVEDANSSNANSDENNNKIKYKLTTSDIMIKIQNIYLDLEQMDDIVKTINIKSTAKPQIVMFDIDKEFYEALKRRLVKYDINDRIKEIEEKYKKYMDEWCKNYKLFFLNYISMIETVKTQVVIPLDLAISTFYAHFKTVTTQGIYPFVYVPENNKKKDKSSF